MNQDKLRSFIRNLLEDIRVTVLHRLEEDMEKRFFQFGYHGFLIESFKSPEDFVRDRVDHIAKKAKESAKGLIMQKLAFHVAQHYWGTDHEVVEAREHQAPGRFVDPEKKNSTGNKVDFHIINDKYVYSVEVKGGRGNSANAATLAGISDSFRRNEQYFKSKGKKLISILVNTDGVPRNVWREAHPGLFLVGASSWEFLSRWNRSVLDDIETCLAEGSGVYAAIEESRKIVLERWTEKIRRDFTQRGLLSVAKIKAAVIQAGGKTETWKHNPDCVKKLFRLQKKEVGDTLISGGQEDFIPGFNREAVCGKLAEKDFKHGRVKLDDGEIVSIDDLELDDTDE